MKNKKKSLEKNPKVFELPITSQTPGRILSGKASTPEENMAIYIYSVVYRSLSDPFVPTHRRIRKDIVLSRFAALVRSH